MGIDIPVRHNLKKPKILDQCVSKVVGPNALHHNHEKPPILDQCVAQVVGTNTDLSSNLKIIIKIQVEVTICF